jgi:arylsulfatase A-like enzyme
MGMVVNSGRTVTAADAQPSANEHPNVIVIVSDDLGYNDLSVQGSKDIPTPNIDSIAQHGSRFTNAYVTAPLCGPSRMGLMSGRYQQRHSTDFMPDYNEGLSLKEKTLGEAFHHAGYATQAVGKWNLGVMPQFRPLQRGFDQFFGFLGALHAYIPGKVPADVVMVNEHPRPGWGIPPDSLNFEAPSIAPATAPAAASSTGPTTGATTTASSQPTTKPAIGSKAGFIVRDDSEQPIKTYLTEAFTQEAVSFIDHHKDSPYFIYLAYNASHSPLEPPKKYVDRFPNLKGKRQLYAATTSALDDGVGQVLAEVRKLGEEKKTIIVFINDNGGPITDTEANNAPLSGTKGSLWEGGIRVPFLVQWPGTLQEGMTHDETVSSMDIYPTVLAAANVPAPAGKELDGTNLLPLLSGKAEPNLADRDLYWRIGGQWAVRQGDWKLEFPEKASPKPLLFDLHDDIGENNDLAAAHPHIVKKLNAMWEKWDELNLPLPTGYKRGQAHGGDPSPIPFKEEIRYRDNDS